MKITNGNLDDLGMIPVVQNVSALVRLVHGIKLIAKSVLMIQNNSHAAKATAKLGLKHVGRAVVESIPLISFVALLIFELNRSHSVSCHHCVLVDKQTCTDLINIKERDEEVIFSI